MHACCPGVYRVDHANATLQKELAIENAVDRAKLTDKVCEGGEGWHGQAGERNRAPRRMQPKLYRV